MTRRDLPAAPLVSLSSVADKVSLDTDHGYAICDLRLGCCMLRVQGIYIYIYILLFSFFLARIAAPLRNGERAHCRDSKRETSGLAGVVIPSLSLFRDENVTNGKKSARMIASSTARLAEINFQQVRLIVCIRSCLTRSIDRSKSRDAGCESSAISSFSRVLLILVGGMIHLLSFSV